MIEEGQSLRLPAWVPDIAERYLLHTEAGRPIREIARDLGCHASTVLRQIRRVETLRDDPLVDEALRRISLRHAGDEVEDDDEAAARLDTNLLRVLRRLAESGAVLAIAAEMEKGVVVRDGIGEVPARTAVVDRDLAQVMALNEWIDCQTQGRVSRYVITPAGRAELGRLVAQDENRARAAASETGQAPAGTGAAPSRRASFAPGESPLVALARRKDRDGKAFLTDDLVLAGERLREDFELAQMTADPEAGWRRFLRPATAVANPAEGRVIAALAALGPGLADVALRCCCLLEGLEVAERRMGWSARSGKIVLRIALTQLMRHYAAQGEAHRMIG